jgi:hypothetical protein
MTGKFFSRCPQHPHRPTRLRPPLPRLSRKQRAGGLPHAARSAAGGAAQCAGQGRDAGAAVRAAGSRVSGAWRAEECRAHGKCRHVSTWLIGEALFSGLYLNELLIRLLPAEDPHPGVFDHYAATLLALAEGRPLEPLLRSFEWRCSTISVTVSALTPTSMASPLLRMAYIACKWMRGWNGSTCCNRGCSMALSCWRWPKPIGPLPARCLQPSV